MLMGERLEVGICGSDASSRVTTLAITDEQ